MTQNHFVYILTTKKNTVLYTGFTEDLANRVSRHKQGFASAFTKRYNVNKLVYFELHADAQCAARREKRLKRWNREWKEDLIEKMNPDWKDLYEDLGNGIPAFAGTMPQREAS